MFFEVNLEYQNSFRIFVVNIKKQNMEIGKIVTYRGQGIYKVLTKQLNSRTLFEIEDIDKGKGWCEATQKYIGVKTPNGWYRGQNHDYGTQIIRHKKHLKLIANDGI